jgi:hypothetical protein
MKIKMLTTSAGPDPTLNWSEGQKRTVDDEEAQALVDAGVAVSLELIIAKLADAPAEDEDDFTEGGYSAKHKGGGSWQVLNAAGEVVAEGLKKEEAKAKADELTAADAAKSADEPAA